MSARTLSALLARIGTEQFAFPLGEVLEVVDAPPIGALALLPAGVVGQVEHRGALLPVLDVGRLLGARRASHSGGVLLLVDVDGDRAALWADDVVDLVAVDPARVRPVPGAGATGTVVLEGVMQVAGGVAGLVAMDAVRALVRARLTSEVR